MGKGRWETQLFVVVVRDSGAAGGPCEVGNHGDEARRSGSTCVFALSFGIVMWDIFFGMWVRWTKLVDEKGWEFSSGNFFRGPVVGN